LFSLQHPFAACASGFFAQQAACSLQQLAPSLQQLPASLPDCMHAFPSELSFPLQQDIAAISLPWCLQHSMVLLTFSLARSLVSADILSQHAHEAGEAESLAAGAVEFVD
jgi:hypothetical protein